MTTIEDKLRLFAKIVFEKVEKDSEQKVMDFTHSHEQLVEEEKKNIIKQSENHIKQARKKAETRKSQIISKATIDMQHSLLKKRKEIFDIMVSDIKRLAESFTTQPEYLDFLEKCIENCLSQIDAKEAVLYFKPQDIDKHSESIKEMILKHKKRDMEVSADKTDKELIGGCVCEDRDKTIRIDCSILSLIDENKSLIGKTLMDNLQ